MSINCWMAVLIAVFLSTTAAWPVTLDNSAAARALREHDQRTDAFKCSKPQYRSYSITSILPRDQITPSESIYPSYTVMRRCDQGTGCCRSGSLSCQPKGEPVYENVVVRVTNLTTHDSSTRNLTIEHHVECKCELTSKALLTPPKVTLV